LEEELGVGAAIDLFHELGKASATVLDSSLDNIGGIGDVFVGERLIGLDTYKMLLERSLK